MKTLILAALAATAPLAFSAPADKAKAPAAIDLHSNYVVVISKATASKPEWKQVAQALVKKYKGAVLCEVDKLTESEFTLALRRNKARYAAYVLRPEEAGRVVSNAVNRASRRVDSDPYGDCISGIITGFTAKDALRIAEARKPLVIKRLLGTTNVGAPRFEHSCCITDWTGAPILEQTGYTEPKQTTIDPKSPEGQKGLQGIFAEQLSTQKPQLIVTSSHATQFNLEMPFSRGLIYPSNNRFYLANQNEQMMEFVMDGLSPAMRGQTDALAKLAARHKAESIKPDDTPRVWLAAGNCLFGDAHNSPHSMAVTALSAYTCNQVVGYTVPSWYGRGGWGTLSLLLENVQGTTLAQAWFLNNQYIIHDTLKNFPELMKVRLNDPEMSARFQNAVLASGAKLSEANIKDALGLPHDRDAVTLYGDPAWSATVDESHTTSPLKVTWKNPKEFTITALGDHKGRCAVWFPRAETGAGATGCDAADAVFTNDFIIFPQVEMKKGESRTVRIR